jgi:hypothetical protein
LDHVARTVRQAALIRLVNRTVERARRRTGLQDLGDESCLTGLERLVDSLESEARLSQVGRFAAWFNLLDHLCVRLRLIDYRKRHPQVAEQAIRQPLVITGLPRTGTTILYELIAQDDAFRAPTSWEVTRPLVADTPGSSARRTIRRVDLALGMMEKLAPGFRAIHAIGAQLPQECVYILASAFASEQFAYMYNVPSYRAWALDTDMNEPYRWHARFLQQLQAGAGERRWVLKSPAHLAYLDSLLGRYPDANVVWTHRRPLGAMASFSSLTRTLHGGFSDHVDPVAVGKQECRHFSQVTERGIAQRRGLPQERFFDASFSAICRDPVEVVRQVYEYFDLELRPAVKQRMYDYLARRPRDLYGEHRYSAREFGLDEGLERDLFGAYLAHYAAFLEI